MCLFVYVHACVCVSMSAEVHWQAMNRGPCSYKNTIHTPLICAPHTLLSPLRSSSSFLFPLFLPPTSIHPALPLHVLSAIPLNPASSFFPLSSPIGQPWLTLSFSFYHHLPPGVSLHPFSPPPKVSEESTHVTWQADRRD